MFINESNITLQVDFVGLCQDKQRILIILFQSSLIPFPHKVTIFALYNYYFC